MSLKVVGSGTTSLKNELGAIADKLRAAPLALVFVLALGATVLIAPAKAGLALWGICKLAAGGFAGYWIDRVAYRAESRPHRLEGIARGASEKRRALIIAASVIATGLLP